MLTVTPRTSAPARVGARGTDSVTALDASHAQGLKAAGVDFAVRYLGSVTADELEGILSAGLAFMPVTYGNAFDGPTTVARCRAIGLPAGCTVWLDVEGKAAWEMDPATLIGKINAWADAVNAAGFIPGMYAGAPQPLTSKELYNLHVSRYWHGQGRCVDRTGALAEPSGCGWCMWQMFPSVTLAGVNVDMNVIGQDYESRVPTWAVKA